MIYIIHQFYQIQLISLFLLSYSIFFLNFQPPKFHRIYLLLYIYIYIDQIYPRITRTPDKTRSI